MAQAPIIDLRTFTTSELDLSPLSRPAREALLATISVEPTGSEDDHDEFHLSTCGRASGKHALQESPLANLYYHLAECCEYDLPSWAEHATTLGRLLTLVRSEEVQTTYMVTSATADVEDLLANPDYAPLATQLRAKLTELDERNRDWIRTQGPSALLDEAARRSCLRASASPAPTVFADYVDELMGEVKHKYAEVVAPEDAAAARERLEAAQGQLLVEVRAFDHVFEERIGKVMIPGHEFLLEDAFREHVLTPRVALIPMRYRPLAEVPHREYRADVVVTDVTDEAPGVLETACTLLRDGGLGCQEALELARELV
jgi:hypothetical protein